MSENPDESDKIELFLSDDQKIKVVGELLTNNSSRSILQLLFEEELTATEIAQKTDVSLQLVKYHLNKMQQVGMVKITKTEKNIKSHDMKYYKATKFAIVILPSKVSKRAKESKLLARSFKTIYKFAGVGVAAVAGLFSISYLQEQSQVAVRVPEPVPSEFSSGEGIPESTLEGAQTSQPVNTIPVAPAIQESAEPSIPRMEESSQIEQSSSQPTITTDSQDTSIQPEPAPDSSQSEPMIESTSQSNMDVQSSEDVSSAPSSFMDESMETDQFRESFPDVSDGVDSVPASVPTPSSPVPSSPSDSIQNEPKEPIIQHSSDNMDESTQNISNQIDDQIEKPTDTIINETARRIESTPDGDQLRESIGIFSNIERALESPASGAGMPYLDSGGLIGMYLIIGAVLGGLAAYFMIRAKRHAKKIQQ